MSEELEFFKRPEPITQCDETVECDVAVVGAGSPGVPCAIRAGELGMKVAVLQKESYASACGNFGAGILLDKSDPEQVEACVSLLVAGSDYRAKRGILETWAKNSGVAVSWMVDRAKKAGCQVVDMGTAPHKAFLAKEGWDKLNFTTCVFGPKPYNTGVAVQELADWAEKNLPVKVYYKTPAVQLIQDETGRVTGVIGKDRAGKFIRFNAKKGVVMATGDYANDKRMMDYYLPDVTNLELKRRGRDGDGQKMIVWAGGRMENAGHTKMVHDMDAGPATMMSHPYLRVKASTGRRFSSEMVPMEYMNCFLLSKEDAGHYCQIFDSNYIEQAKKLGLPVEDTESLKNWMPEEKIEHKGVMEGLIDTWKADTLEELAKKLRIQDVPAFLETVKHYNEMAHAGKDTEFGVPADHLCPVEAGPFYGIHRHVRFTVGCSGVEINERLECLDKDDKPIPGLYAIGNLAGNFYGSVDYPLDIFGLNLGHNYTEGYVVAEELAKL